VQTQKKPLSFARLIGTSMAAKSIVDMGSQIFNPFLPLISAGLGIGVIDLGRLVGLRSSMGIFAPVSGVLADRFGYRKVIRIALLFMGAGFLLLSLSNTLWMAVVAMILSGLGTGTFVPNLHAFVSSKLSYKLRARGLGMIEYSWALTGIVGLSLIGLLIAATGWRTPFVLLAAALVAMSFVFGSLPADGEGASESSEMSRGSWRLQLASLLKVSSNRRSTWATILAGSLSFFAAVQVMIAHGAWLVDQYGLDAAKLGLVALIFGFFDLTASVSVSLFTDRLGKKRSVIIGIVGSIICYALMPVLNVALVSAVAIMGAARMCFEFNIVSHFPLLSEQVPTQRGQVMTLGSAMMMIAGTLAGFSGPWLYVNLGVAALAWTSAAAVTIGCAIVLVFVRE